MGADRQRLRKGRPATERRRPPLRGLPGYLEADGPPDLDRIVHERIRLGMLSALAVNEAVTFTELRELLNATDGNLSVHARKLEDAGYVTCTKSFQGRTPQTRFTLTARGRKALERYLDHMEALIQATRGR